MELKWNVLRKTSDQNLLVDQLSKIYKFSIKNRNVLIHHRNNVLTLCEFMSDQVELVKMMSIQFERNIIKTFQIDDQLLCLDSLGGINQLKYSNELQYIPIHSIDNVKMVNGLSNGMAIVEEVNHGNMLKIFKYKNNSLIFKLSELILENINFIETLNPKELNFNFLKYFFKDISYTCSDIILYSTERGSVFLIPLYSQYQKLTPVAIFHTSGVLVSAQVVEESIFLFYQSGKLVILHWKNNFEFQEFFLTDILTSNILIKDNILNIIWSDGISLCLASIQNLSELNIGKISKQVKGVTHLIKFSENMLLAVTLNGIFYKIFIELSDQTPVIDATCSDLLFELQETQRKIDKIQSQIALSKEQIIALEIEKEKNLFQVNFIGNILSLMNNSTEPLSKNIWKLQIVVEKNSNCLTKFYDFNCTLEPKMSEKFKISNSFLCNACKMDVRLIGFTCNTNRLLSIFLDNFIWDKCDDNPVIISLNKFTES